MLLNSRKNQLFYKEENNSQNDITYNYENPIELYQRIKRQEWYIGSLIIVLLLVSFGIFLWFHFSSIKAEEDVRDAVFEIKSKVVNRELSLYLNEKGYTKPDNTEWNKTDIAIAYDGIRSSGSGAAGTAYVDTNEGSFEIYFTYHPEDGISIGEPILLPD